MKLPTQEILNYCPILKKSVWLIPEKGHGLRSGPGLPPQLAHLLSGTQPSSCRGMWAWPGCRPAALPQALFHHRQSLQHRQIKLLADSANRSPGLYIIQHSQESPPSHTTGPCQQSQPSCAFRSSTGATCLEGHKAKAIEQSLETPTSHTAAAHTPCSLCLPTFHTHPGESTPHSLHASLASTTCHEELSTAHPYSSIPSAPPHKWLIQWSHLPVLNTSYLHSHPDSAPQRHI